MSEVAVRWLLPGYRLDLTGVRTDAESGDYARDDLTQLMGQPRVFDEAISLYWMAPAPAIAICCGPGETRALCARLRLSGVRAQHLDDLAAADDRRRLAADLGAGRIDLVAIVTPRGTSAVPGVRGIMILKPARLAAVHARFLSLLDTADGAEVVIYDLARNHDHHEFPTGWSVTVVQGQPAEVVKDPYLDKLADLPHRTALQWAGDNIERIELLRAATNRKPGWSFHVLQAVAGKAAAERWWNSQKSS
jgi:hypothetical protein